MSSGSDMDVEPNKTVTQYVQEWIQHYIGGAPSPLINYPDETRLPVIVSTPSESAERLRQEQEAWRLTLELRRQHAETREALRRVILSRPVFYIGHQTITERNLAFMNAVTGLNRHTVRGNLTLDKKNWIQNPYDLRTWRSRNDLEVANNLIKATFGVSTTGQGPSKELFERLYSKEAMETVQVVSYSKPELVLLRPKNKNLLKGVLYGDDELLLKITPFIDRDGKLIDNLRIQQIYNEIQIAFFLNELIYGYSHVLSIHFMVIVDWFQATRAAIGLFKSPFHSPLDSLTNQVTIVEFAHTQIKDFMRQQPTLASLRAITFQVFHALETARITNEFVHYDLHLGNVLLKRTDYADSPFNSRNLLYKRHGYPNWYRLPYEDLGGHIVKIIDFGFSRLYAPSTTSHKVFDRATGEARHLHSRPIGLNWEVGEMNVDEPNWYADVRMFLIEMLTLPHLEVWQAMAKDEREPFYAFTEDILDFGTINRLIDDAPEPIQDERRLNAQGRLRASNIVHCPQCATYLTSFHGYARSAQVRKGRSATDALNHAFFEPLQRVPQAMVIDDSTTTTLLVAHDDVVVSFFTVDGKEEAMLKMAASPTPSTNTTTPLKCVVCGAKAEHYNVEADERVVPLCGALCAEFKYLYHEKTVFR